jgi:hypothetical protein
LYRTGEDVHHSRAFLGLDFRRWEPLCARIYSENKFVLKADISRFFYTAYTHSIPWAVLTKKKAKEWFLQNKLSGHWSNDFDRAIQACQSRETFGIPVGPDTSRIIAEILLAGIEADKSFKQAVQGRTRCRLLDDFIIGFDDEDAARTALSALRSALWEFNLQLNEEKTGIFPSKTMFRPRWKLELETAIISKLNSKLQETDIYRFIDLTMSLCDSTGDGGPAIWAARRLSSINPFPENLGLILESLFRLARDFPACMHHVAAFLVNHQKLFHTKQIKNRIGNWVRTTLKTHFQHSNDFELAWCLLIAGVLRIPIEENDITDFDKLPSATVFATLGMLRERNILKFSLSKWDWRISFQKTGIHGEYWLPFYEAVRRKWTTHKGIVTAVKNDSFLSKLLNADVTFLADEILDATQINISKRVFKKAKLNMPYDETLSSSPDEDDVTSDVSIENPLSVLEFNTFGYE